MTVKLRRQGNSISHIPTSAFIGRDRITVFYQGQPRLCYKCGSKAHFSVGCKEIKCSLCQKLGHVAKECRTIRCNLCFKEGHPYSQCPEAWANIDEQVRAEMQKPMGEAPEGNTADGKEMEASVHLAKSVSKSAILRSVPSVSCPRSVSKKSAASIKDAAMGAGAAPEGRRLVGGVGDPPGSFVPQEGVVGVPLPRSSSSAPAPPSPSPPSASIKQQGCPPPSGLPEDPLCGPSGVSVKVGPSYKSKKRKKAGLMSFKEARKKLVERTLKKGVPLTNRYQVLSEDPDGSSYSSLSEDSGDEKSEGEEMDTLLSSSSKKRNRDSVDAE